MTWLVYKNTYEDAIFSRPASGYVFFTDANRRDIGVYDPFNGEFAGIVGHSVLSSSVEPDATQKFVIPSAMWRGFFQQKGTLQYNDTYVAYFEELGRFYALVDGELFFCEEAAEDPILTSITTELQGLTSTSHMILGGLLFSLPSIVRKTN